MKKISDEELFVDTWLMSCRVLKRGMEEFVINRMVETVKEKGFKVIFSEYVPTSKNCMVKNLYEAMGFHRTEKNLFCVEVNDFKKMKTYIKEVKENGTK